MAVPDGYKIYWGTDGNLDGVHPDPAKSQYNSPITVVGGTLSQYTFPSDFWDNSFTTLYFSLAAYAGAEEGTRSTPVQLGTCIKEVGNGLQPFSIPLDDGNTYTPQQLRSVLGASTLLVDEGESVLKSYNSFTPDGTVLSPSQGVLAIMSTPKTITWHGKAWSSV